MIRLFVFGIAARTPSAPWKSSNCSHDSMTSVLMSFSADSVFVMVFSVVAFELHVVHCRPRMDVLNQAGHARHAHLRRRFADVDPLALDSRDYVGAQPYRYSVRA